MILRRRVILNGTDIEGVVDLGLPSGLLWAKGNLCKDNHDNYSIGEKTDWGTYVSWGNIDGHNEGEGYSFNQTNYDNTSGKQVTANIPSNDSAHDIALATLGTPWHLPTKEDFQELYDNTDSEWAVINGVAGRKFMKKSDHSVYVFFPTSGRYNGTTLDFRDTYGYYWSASFSDSTHSYGLLFSSTGVSPQNNFLQYFGLTVHPVCKLIFSVAITLTGDSVSGIAITVTDSDGVAHSGTSDANGVVRLSGVVSGNAIVRSNEYIITPNNINISSSSTTFTLGCEIAVVDLGLPSGLLWAKGNLCKDSQGNYYIGEETDYGTYVSWGNIDGHNEGEGYNFNQTTYDSTAGKSVSGNIPNNDAAHDIAFARLGTPYHLPTKDNFQEMYDNTDTEWVADYNGTGVPGRKFMKKSDHSVYIFFPAGSYYDGASLKYRGMYGRYWSSSLRSSSSANRLGFDSSSVKFENNSRRYGFLVRAVCNP